MGELDTTSAEGITISELLGVLRDMQEEKEAEAVRTEPIQKKEGAEL